MINTVVKDKCIFECTVPDYKIYVYGNVYNKKQLNNLKNYCSKFDLEKFALNLSGYFIIILKSINEILIINDIFGNYRFYYSHDKAKTTFTCSNIYQELNKINTFDENKSEREYLKRHRYTTGFGCINNNIKKMPPASIISFKGNILSKKLYFTSKYAPKLNQELYVEENKNLVTENMLDNINNNKPTILLFSGGVDSIFLSEILRRNRKKYQLLFIKYDYPDLDNLNDEKKVKKYTNYYQTKVDFMEYKISQVNKCLNSMISNQPQDITPSVFYDVLNNLYSQYGSCNIINGQSSDSIYCWGNSSFTYGALLQRVISSSIYLKLPILFKLIYGFVIKLLYKRRKNLNGFSIPYKYDDMLVGLVDPDGYLPVLTHSKRDYDYLKKIINVIKSNIHDAKDIIFYLKLMYLQGPSNIPWINASRLYKHNLIMPFLDSRIATNKIKNQNEFREVIQPRYELLDYMQKKFNINKKYFRFKKYFPTQHEQKLINLYHEKTIEFYSNYLEQM